MDNTELTVGWDELTVRLRDRGVRGRHVGLEGGGKLEGWGALGVCRVCYGAMLPLYVSLWGKVGAGPVHSAREHLSWPWEMTWGRQARRNPTNTLGGAGGHHAGLHRTGTGVLGRSLVQPRLSWRWRTQRCDSVPKNQFNEK